MTLSDGRRVFIYHRDPHVLAKKARKSFDSVSDKELEQYNRDLQERFETQNTLHRGAKGGGAVEDFLATGKVRSITKPYVSFSLDSSSAGRFGDVRMEFDKSQLQGRLKAVTYAKTRYEKGLYRVQAFYADQQEVRGIQLMAPKSALRRIVVRDEVLKNRIETLLRKRSVEISVVVRK